MRGKMDAQVLLESFPLHVPPRSTRTLTLFTVPRARVKTVETGMFCRLAKNMNAYWLATWVQTYFMTVLVFLELVSSTMLFAYFKSIQAVTFVCCLCVKLLL